MKILILSGFLGAGKTTVLIQLAKYLAADGDAGSCNVAIIENEIGQTGIDSILFAQDYAVRTLFSGCICCTVSHELVNCIEYIQATQSPQWLIIESTGMAEPEKIRNQICTSLDLPATIVTVADAKRLSRLMAPLGNLIRSQIAPSDFLLLNKIDLVDKQVLKQTRQLIHNINPQIMIFEICALQKIDPLIFRIIASTTGNEINEVNL